MRLLNYTPGNEVKKIFRMQDEGFQNLNPKLYICSPVVRDVAQPGSALAWGARGRKFESCRPDCVRRSFSEGGLRPP